jgi:phytoene dehydrogenase-like protein
MEHERFAPAAGDNWFVMLVKKPGKHTDIAEGRALAIEMASYCLNQDVEPLIEVEHIMTPIDIANHTYAEQGALYGTASNHPMAAFRRHPNKHPSIKGLYFAGGTVHPGGGIPLCLRSGRLAVELMLANDREA